MPTKPLLPITELDFFQIKNQLKAFIRADPSNKYTDIDFEGSNISVLLDVLAYNTYQNNFYTNMAISEMFLDSAQLENSIVSHAKELNYLPRSATSASAVISVSIRDPQNTNSTIVIPENTRFTTSHDGTRYNFYTQETYIARRSGESYIAENITIFEGELQDEAFFVTGNRKSIRLLNQNIDISSIRVFEFFDEPLDRAEYVFRNDIFGVTATDLVFYVEPSFDSTYEIVFGNNRFGKTPEENVQVRVFYRICSGDEANGACRFTTNFRTNTTVTTVSSAVGGSPKETLSDTKFFAPKSIQIQERAVTERDYEILLKQRFNEIDDISVIGGDELDPPRYGKVGIAVNVEGGLSEIARKTYENYLSDKTPIGIQPIFLAPEFLYARLVIDAFYDPKQTSKSKDQIEKQIRDILSFYNTNSLEKFGAIFELSRVSALIDNSDASIYSNTMTASPYILYAPEVGIKNNPVFNFGTALRSPCRFATANNTEVYNSLIRSSEFVYEGINAIFEDNGLGSINIIDSAERGDGVFKIIKRDIGTVDYTTGLAKLSDFIVEAYEGNGIRVFADTEEKNISSPKTKVLSLKDTDITINIREITRNVK
jgi:hypothetical protein